MVEVSVVLIAAIVFRGASSFGVALTEVNDPYDTKLNLLETRSFKRAPTSISVPETEYSPPWVATTGLNFTLSVALSNLMAACPSKFDPPPKSIRIPARTPNMLEEASRE